MTQMNFDPEQAWLGTFDAEGVRYDAYRMTYCEKPVTGLDWSGTPSEEFFKMNIKVPAGLTGEEKRHAQILVYNPWGGDMGQTPSAPDALDNAMKVAVLRAGWILVEPGMRGNNCFTGTPGGADYCDFGKLPWPLVDLKAAIRCLRFGENAVNISGDKERIWIAGTSSGGCASTIIGTSGDAELFLPYLAEIGAADTSDAVYGSAPSCPVMIRSFGDAALSWERWDEMPEDADPCNAFLWEIFPELFDGIGLKAELDLPETGLKAADPLTAEDLKPYLYQFVRRSAVKFLNSLGSREAIDAYLSEKKPGDPMYGTTETDRSWIRPVFAEHRGVTDISGTYAEFWKYTLGERDADPHTRITWQYDKTMTAPDDLMLGNGVVKAEAGDPGLFSPDAWVCPSSPSFGKPGDYACVFTAPGRKWITERRGIEVTPEYLTLIDLQRDCVDPLAFLSGRRGAAKVAEKWFLRTGTVDLVTPHPLFIGLGTRLMNLGKQVDMEFVWDQTHGLTADLEGFMRFAGRV